MLVLCSELTSCMPFSVDFLDINLLRLHRQVLDRNGFETWRQLCQLFEPRTKSRSISLLQALMSLPNFDKSRTLLEQIQSLERIREEFQKTSGTSPSDDIMTSTLLRVLPKHIQQHLHLQMTRLAQVTTGVLGRWSLAMKLPLQRILQVESMRSWM